MAADNFPPAEALVFLSMFGRRRCPPPPPPPPLPPPPTFSLLATVDVV